MLLAEESTTSVLAAGGGEADSEIAVLTPLGWRGAGVSYFCLVDGVFVPSAILVSARAWTTRASPRCSERRRRCAQCSQPPCVGACRRCGRSCRCARGSACWREGEAAAKDILECWDKLDDPPEILSWDESRVTDSDEEVVIKQNWTEIRRFMWNYVGIVRTTKRLERAAHRIRLLRDEVEDYYGHFRVTTDLIELRNLLECADLIVSSALKRHESRGLHFILDYPETNPIGRDTVLVP